jgi:hypothetical protein
LAARDEPTAMTVSTARTRATENNHRFISHPPNGNRVKGRESSPKSKSVSW